MSRRKPEKIACTYFTWIIFERNGILYADGRSHNAGKHSLGTGNRDEALRELVKLDLQRAVELGLAPPHLLQPQAPDAMELEVGWKLYLARINRSRSLGGLAKSSVKRYRAVFDKFIPFARERHFKTWNLITKDLVEDYLAWLDDEDYSHGSIYFEVTCIKQLIKWLIVEKKIPESCRLVVKVPKPNASDRYCWTREEVDAMVEYCRSRPDIVWMMNVIIALSRTGLRISELAGLRWSDISKGYETITLTDERSQSSAERQIRTLKTGRNRTLPIHQSLKVVLESLHHHEDGLIFHGPLGGKLKPDTVRNVLIREVLEPLAKQYPAWKGTGFLTGRLHSFRHFFCSECASQSVPEQTLMTWLGHASAEMVKRYFHLHDDTSKQFMRGLHFDAPRDNSQSA